jgi:hypothetical protein
VRPVFNHSIRSHALSKGIPHPAAPGAEEISIGLAKRHQPGFLRMYRQVAVCDGGPVRSRELPST